MKDKEIEKLWNHAKIKMRDELSYISFSTWISPLTFEVDDDGNLCVYGVPDYYLPYVSRRFLSRIYTHMEDLYGASLPFQVYIRTSTSTNILL